MQFVVQTACKYSNLLYKICKMYWYNIFIYNNIYIYILKIYILVLPGTNEHSHFQYRPHVVLPSTAWHARLSCTTSKRPALGAAERASCLKRPPGIVGEGSFYAGIVQWDPFVLGGDLDQTSSTCKCTSMVILRTFPIILHEVLGRCPISWLPCHEGWLLILGGARFLERYRFDVFVFVLS